MAWVLGKKLGSHFASILTNNSLEVFLRVVVVTYVFSKKIYIVTY